MNRASKLVLCMGIILLQACGTKNESNSQEISSLEVSVPIQMDTTISQEFVADIHAINNVEIRARVKGYLDKIHVDEGKAVRKGQVLFTINNLEYLAEVMRAKSVLNQTMADIKAEELELINTRLLVDRNVIAKNQLSIALAKIEGLKAKKEEAEAHVKAAQLRVEYSSIRAPFDGVVDRLPFKSGSLVDEGTLLTTLSDTKNVFAYFNVSEKEYLAFAELGEGFKNNTAVTLLLANGDLYPHTGKVETIEGEFDKNTGNIAFRARFDNPEKLLKHGSSGRVQMPKKVNGYWLIPQKAVFEIQEKNYVFVKDKTGMLKMKSLVPEIRMPHFYLVKGFNSADTLLVEGIQLVKQGQKIKGEYIPMRRILEKSKTL
ncbi:efflux RND transporter periplasmic adaptor subunit [Aquirufa nivalisilvae]|uniref:efflux RND transporter periplasmic adaptor subunit n=1 Tax=Aquirufa nivalisilvae TaxID=2516557 RepID=UPI0022A9CC4F|nr:efflux RND transporter periplasmic adaptor subunit [Aquirufa nivalisilvae]MCZ2478800.1 efflux RND transporter periplasmic adaptor subunit [Aquirufa nivalisilvae]MCZ2483536.1 efflux RND transporter periplasmic adaptor subunit [Aquirufa nivalisilvae]